VRAITVLLLEGPSVATAPPWIRQAPTLGATVSGSARARNRINRPTDLFNVITASWKGGIELQPEAIMF
jgi:hypothetical protein